MCQPPIISIVLAATLVLANAAWKTYDIEGVKLALLTPPKRMSSAGLEPGTRMWSAVGDQAVVVGILPIQKDQAPDHNLAINMAGLAEGYGGKIVAQKDILHRGWPGLAMTLETKDLGPVKVVSYRTAKGIVSVTVAPAFPNLAANTNRVLNSVTLGPRWGMGPLKTAGPAWSSVDLKPLGAKVDLPGQTSYSSKPGTVGESTPVDQWSSLYGNREYAVISETLNAELTANWTPEDRWKHVQTSNEAILSEGGTKVLRRAKGTLLGEPSERLDIEAKEPGFVRLHETTVRQGRVVIAIAIVPKALQNSAEVTRFFASLKP